MVSLRFRAASAPPSSRLRWFRVHPQASARPGRERDGRPELAPRRATEDLSRRRDREVRQAVRLHGAADRREPISPAVAPRPDQLRHFHRKPVGRSRSRREEEPTLETPRGNEPSATPAGPAEQRKQVSTIVERTRGPVVLNDLGLNAFGVKLLRTELMIEDAFGGYLQVDEVKHGTRS